MPFETIAHRFPRMVRDISTKLGKKIQFNVIGSEIEMDRSILEKLGDPLLHILRNSVDHGIESVEEREALGKDPEGKITITLLKEREEIILKIEDDGRGMDPDKIGQLAIARNLVKPEQLHTMNDEDKFLFITQSGFSTATEVSDISGRGVGMDVVKHTIESIGGILNIGSEKGKGSVFSLRIPFTIAIIKVLLISLDGRRYAIPINQVNKTLEVKRENLLTQKGQMMISFMDEIVQLHSMRKLLKIEDEQRPSVHNNLSIVLTLIRNTTHGFIVDELIGQEEVVVKALNKPLETIRGLTGVTILGDGGIVLILDIFNLL